MKCSHVFAVVLVIAVVMVTSVSAASTAVYPEIKAPAGKGAARPAGQQKWESTVVEAKKEGSVRLYHQWGPKTRAALSHGFKEKFGIELEPVTFARGAEIVAKVQEEKRAGIYVADIFGVGSTTLLTSMKPGGLLRSLEPILILPEVTDAKAWSGGQLPFVDRDKTTIAMLSAVQRYIIYHTGMVREGEITSYKDLLKPQYKGKIVLGDPSIAGAGNAWFTHLSTLLWNSDEASDFLRKLIIQQEAVVLRDHHMLVEWVSRGKYAIGIAGKRESVTQFVEAGAPVGIAVQKEGHGVTPSAGCVAMPSTVAHPNASVVFLNWLLTKEGQTLFSKSFGIPSTRVDVTQEDINPLFLARPGEKIFPASEKETILADKMQDVAKKVLEKIQK